MKVPLSPLQLTWDITNRCPARCIHCYNASDRDGGAVRDWPPGLVEGVLEDIVRTRPLTLGIGGGDPLVFPGLAGLVGAIHGLAGPHMPSVVIGTNGFRLDRQRDLVRTVLEIYSETPFAVLFYLSLHGSHAELHDSVMGARGAFNQAMAAARFLRSHDLPFGMGVTPLTVNLDDLDRVVDVALAEGATCLNVSQFVPTGRGSASLDLSREQYRWLTEWIVGKNAELGRFYVVTHEHYIAAVDPVSFRNRLFVGCTAGIYQLGIRPNGDVVPCPLLPVVVGNVRNRKLQELWTGSEELERLRRRGVAEPCGSCVMKHKCGGCRAVAHAYTGDYLGPDPLCPYSAAEVRELLAAGGLPGAAAIAAGAGHPGGGEPTPGRPAGNGYRKAPFPYKEAFPGDVVVLNRLTSQLVSVSGSAADVYGLLPPAGDAHLPIEDLRSRHERVHGRPLEAGDLASLVEAGLVDRTGAA